MPSFNHSTSSSAESPSTLRPQEDFSSHQTSSDKRPKRRATFLKMFAIFGMIGLVLGPLVVSESPKEIARWFLAAAIEKQSTGDYPAAYDLLARAITWNPSSSKLVLQQAQWKLAENLPLEALGYCNQILQLHPKLAEGFFLRSLVQQRLANHSAALDDLDQIVKLALDDYCPLDTAFNARAYGRALAIDDKQLDASHLKKALEDVEQAIKSQRLNADYLDTRGFLYFLQEDYDPALKDLNQAVDLSEKEFDILLFSVEQASLEQAVIDKIKQEREHLAVIYHHRYRILEKLGQKQKSERDHQRAMQLGYNPAEGVR